MKNTIIYVGILFFLGGCSLIPASGERYKKILDSFTGDNLTKISSVGGVFKPPYKVKIIGKYRWNYYKHDIRKYRWDHSENPKMNICKVIFITTLDYTIVDNIIQTPSTCKSGFSGVF